MSTDNIIFRSMIFQSPSIFSANISYHLLQGDPTSPFWRRSALGFLWREWCWSWNSSTLATSEKSWLIGKDSVAGRDGWQEEKGTTEDEMAGWHHWLDGCESEWTLGVCDGQGGLACCNSWGRKESDTTERLNWIDWDPYLYYSLPTKA